MFDSGNNPASPALLIEELANDPDASRSARDCRWVPGTGYCRNHPCRPGCLFRRQKEAEAAALLRSRRERRSWHRRFIRRMLPLSLPFLCVFSTAAFITIT